MGKTHFNSISLQELVQRSDYILLVERLEPVQTIERISVKWNKKEYPPYVIPVSHFEVKKVLFSVQDSFSQTKILIYPARYHMGLKVHKDYCIQGKSRSFIVDSYLEKGFTKIKNLIVFLNKSDKFEFSVRNAYESVDAVDNVLEFINQTKWSKFG